MCPRVAKELSALEVKRLTKSGMYAVGGMPGLHLQVLPGGGKTWLLRVTVGINANGKQRRVEIGLGGYPAVTLAQARDKAREFRTKIEQGIDPVAERKAAKSALLVRAMTFEQAANALIQSKESEWRNAKHRQQWTNTLATYAFPVIGKLPVDAIEISHIIDVLNPIWVTKTETAKRLQSRIEIVFDWAIASKKRKNTDNPARWRGNLSNLLAKPGKIKSVKHYPALPYKQLPAFYAELQLKEGISALALQFLILTAARSGEIRGATWAEINFTDRIWIIPAQRMKADKEHRVPLSDKCLEILHKMAEIRFNDLVFPASKGGQLSDMSLTAVLRRMNWIDPKQNKVITAHGFRSTFRDWAAEDTNHPNFVVEMALAHAIGSDVESAYRRGDLFEKRRKLMDDWTEYTKQ